MASRVHRVGDLIEAVLKQVAIRVEGHRRRPVTEHLLHHLDVCTGRDREGSCRVPQLVRIEIRNADRLRSWPEHFPEARYPQWVAAADACEHEIVRLPAFEMLGKIIDEETRNRHLTSLMRLGGTPHHAEALHRRDRLGDHGTTLLQIDTPHAQRRHLPEADTRVGQEQDDEAIHLIRALVVSSMLADLGRVAARLGQGIDLRMGQVAPLVLDRSREVDLSGDVPNEPPVPDGHVEHE
nr:hypothetical protein [Aeromicrobium sp. Root344]